MNIPIIETQRLRLRPHRADDLDACAAMWADPGVTRYIGGKASTRQETWSRMLRYAGMWAFLQYGYWAIESKSSEKYIGELGFADFKRPELQSYDGTPELGWALAVHAHGQGFATEAVAAAVSWGDKHLSAPRTLCIINPENAPSLRLAEKAGFVMAGEAAFGGNPTLLFERLGLAPEQD